MDLKNRDLVEYLLDRDISPCSKNIRKVCQDWACEKLPDFTPKSQQTFVQNFVSRFKNLYKKCGQKKSCFLIPIFDNVKTFMDKQIRLSNSESKGATSHQTESAVVVTDDSEEIAKSLQNISVTEGTLFTYFTMRFT